MEAAVAGLAVEAEAETGGGGGQFPGLPGAFGLARIDVTPSSRLFTAISRRGDGGRDFLSNCQACDVRNRLQSPMTFKT